MEVQYTVVKILKVKEKAKLQSMYLYFVTVPSYTVCLLIFTTISFMEQNIYQFCVQNLAHSSAVQVVSLVP
jgi:hypothetical protein